jgi:uncharacterized protein YcsI (UPF0317 family)
MPSEENDDDAITHAPGYTFVTDVADAVYRQP